MSNITYKIDRLSNNTLQLGLKTGATLTGGENSIVTNRLLKYDSNIKIDDNDKNSITTVEYLNTKLNGILNGLIFSGEGIHLDKSTTTNDFPKYTLSLEQFYTELDEGSTLKTFKNNSDEKSVINAIVVDKYGRIVSIDTKKISTADLDNSNSTFDNYKQWSITAGNVTADILSSYRAADDKTTVVPLTIGSKNGGVIASIDKDSTTLKLDLNIKENGPIVLDSSTKGLTLETLNPSADLTNSFNTSKLYNYTVDTFGRVTSFTEISDVTSLVKKFDGTNAGLVSPISENILNGPTLKTEFYTSEGKWTTIPYTSLDVEAASETVYIVGSPEPTGSVTGKTFSGVTITSDQKIHAAGFEGEGSGLSNLNAEKISKGVINLEHIPQITKAKGGFEISTDTDKIAEAAGSVVFVKIDKNESPIPYLAPVTNPAIPTDKDKNYVLTKSVNHNSSGTGTTNQTAPSWVDVESLITNIVSGTGGMRFVGVLSSVEEFDSISAFSKGDFYKIGAVGTYANNECEVGDTIYAIKSFDAKYNDEDTDKSSYWSVLQGNIERNISLSKSAPTQNISYVLPIKTSGEFTILDPSGLTVKAPTSDVTSWTITASLDGNASTATKLNTVRTLWGQKFDGSNNISGDLSNVGNIIPISTDSNISNIGSTEKYFGTVYATAFKGTADVANKLSNPLTIKLANVVDSYVYDGSEAKEVTIDANSINALSNTSVDINTSDNGNAIVDLTSKIENSVLSFTATKGYLVDSISSTLFNVTKTNGSVKIDPLSTITDSAGKFYSSDEIPNATNKLSYNGYLVANKVYVTSSSTIVPLAESKSKGQVLTDTSSINLLARNDNGNVYDFIDSGLTITNNIANPGASSNKVPTEKAVRNAIDNAIKITDSSLQCAILNVEKSSVTATIGNCTIDHIDISINTKYDSNTSLSLSIDNNTMIAKEETDLSSADNVFTFKILKEFTVGKLNATLNSTPTSGALKIYIYYIKTPVYLTPVTL